MRLYRIGACYLQHIPHEHLIYFCWHFGHRLIQSTWLRPSARVQHVLRPRVLERASCSPLFQLTTFPDAFQQDMTGWHVPRYALACYFLLAHRPGTSAWRLFSVRKRYETNLTATVYNRPSWGPWRVRLPITNPPGTLQSHSDLVAIMFLRPIWLDTHFTLRATSSFVMGQPSISRVKTIEASCSPVLWRVCKANNA